MSKFSAGQNTWQIAKQIVADAAELPPAERDAFVIEQCGDHAILLTEVQSLLAQLDGIDAYIEIPAALPDSAAPNDRDDNNTSFSLTGQTIGAYRLGAQVGSGGMGVVYAAERADGAYQQKVAIKLLRGGGVGSMGTSGNSEQDARRMARERQALAQLDHPHIARLLDGGTTPDAAPYLVMEFIDGEAIDKYCEHEQLDLRERVALVRGVCAAVQSAHQRLLIHRDIKPSNILVTREGIPKLLDFGIARLLEASTEGGSQPQDVTHATALLFTPRYASPEQVRGQAVTVATDVYGLGLLLYELLAGASPYERIASSISGSAAEAMVAVMQDAPRRASEVARKIIHGGSTSAGLNADSVRSVPGTTRFDRNPKQLEGELDTILLKACAKLPAERYQTVAQLDDDLARWLTGKPILARPQTWAYTFFKLVNRHRFATGMITLASTAIIAGVVGTVVQKNRAEAERVKADARYSQIRELAGHMVSDYNLAITKLPGGTPLSKKMADDAVAMLNTLAQDKPDDFGLKLELANAYRTLASTQFSPYYSNQGDTKAFDAANAKAIALVTSVREINAKIAGPAKIDRAAEVAWFETQQALALGAQGRGDYEKSVSLLQDITEHFHALSAKFPADLKYREIAIDAQCSIAQQSNAFLKRTAQPSLNNAKIDFEPWMKLQPDADSVFQFTVRLLHSEHLQARFEKDENRAVDLLDKEIQLKETRFKLRPNDAELRQSIAANLISRSGIMLQQARYSDALHDQSRAFMLLKPLAAIDEKDMRVRAAMAMLTRDRGNALSKLGRDAEALQAFDEAYALCTPLFNTDSTTLQVVRSCVNVSWWTTRFRLKMGKDATSVRDPADKIVVAATQYPAMFTGTLETLWLRNAREAIAGDPLTPPPAPAPGVLSATSPWAPPNKASMPTAATAVTVPAVIAPAQPLLPLDPTQAPLPLK